MINLFIYYSQRKRFIRTLVMHYLKAGARHVLVTNEKDGAIENDADASEEDIVIRAILSSKSVLGVLQPPRKETDERF